MIAAGMILIVFITPSLCDREQLLMCSSSAISRGFEEIESTSEELTEPNFKGSDADLKDPERFFR